MSRLAIAPLMLKACEGSCCDRNSAEREHYLARNVNYDVSLSRYERSSAPTLADLGGPGSRPRNAMAGRLTLRLNQDVGWDFQFAMQVANHVER
jgi:hypothetical protein